MSSQRYRRFGFSLALVACALGPAAAAGQSYADGPLHTPVAIPDDEMASTWPEFRAQLAAVPALDVELATRLREHLFALVSADAKRRAARGEPVLPRRDAQLAEMFDWGARLGIAGADLVATRLRGSGAEPLRAELPGSFALLFDTAYTMMALDDGWLVRFPHYFMIGPTLREPLENGAVTTVAVLSTLFADDSSSALGASQATIAIIAAQQEAGEMTGFWLGRFGIPPFAVVEPAVPGAMRTYRSRDENSPLVNELVVFALPRGTIIFAYSGSQGTFEANRAHFLDLMNSLRVHQQ